MKFRQRCNPFNVLNLKDPVGLNQKPQLQLSASVQSTTVAPVLNKDGTMPKPGQAVYRTVNEVSPPLLRAMKVEMCDSNPVERTVKKPRRMEDMKSFPPPSEYEEKNLFLSGDPTVAKPPLDRRQTVPLKRTGVKEMETMAEIRARRAKKSLLKQKMERQRAVQSLRFGN